MRDTKAHYEKKRTARTTTTSKQVSRKSNERLFNEWWQCTEGNWYED